MEIHYVIGDQLKPRSQAGLVLHHLLDLRGNHGRRQNHTFGNGF